MNDEIKTLDNAVKQLDEISRAFGGELKKDISLDEALKQLVDITKSLTKTILQEYERNHSTTW